MCTQCNRMGAWEMVFVVWCLHAVCAVFWLAVFRFVYAVVFVYTTNQFEHCVIWDMSVFQWVLVSAGGVWLWFVYISFNYTNKVLVPNDVYVPESLCYCSRPDIILMFCISKYFNGPDTWWMNNTELISTQMVRQCSWYQARICVSCVIWRWDRHTI